MKKLYCLIILFVACRICQGQNLVVNPDFENYSLCPSAFGQMSYATGWSNFSWSPDYHHSCSISGIVGTPSNSMGYQVPHSGNAYAGLVSYYTSIPGYREIIGSQLISPLVVGENYNISFYVSLAIKPPHAAFACNKIGAKFTTVPFNNQMPINNIAHLHQDTIITDTTNWKLIAGSFIADSAYTYIAIGNFFDDANTDTLHIGSNFTGPWYYAYYYIDDVSIVAVGEPTDVVTNDLSNQFDLFPNPFNDKLNITVKKNELAEIILYDITSRKLLQKKLTNSATINTEQLAKGIYIYEVRSKNGLCKQGKIVKD